MTVGVLITWSLIRPVLPASFDTTSFNIVQVRPSMFFGNGSTQMPFHPWLTTPLLHRGSRKKFGTGAAVSKRRSKRIAAAPLYEPHRRYAEEIRPPLSGFVNALDGRRE